MVEEMKAAWIIQCTRKHMKESQLIGNLLSLTGIEMMCVALRDYIKV